MIGLVAGLVIPLSLLEAWATRNSLGGSSLGELLSDPTLVQQSSTSSSAATGGFVVTHTLDLAVTAFGGVAVSRVINGWLEGDEMSALAALRFTVGRIGALAATFVVIHVLELVGLVMAVVPGLAVIVLSSLTSPVLAIEQLGPIDSIRRSWTLVRRRLGSVVGIIVLLAAVNYGVSQAIGTMPNAVALFVGPDRAWPLVAASNTAISLILVPVTSAAMCLTYFDIRFRTEGLDLHRRIREHFGSGAS